MQIQRIQTLWLLGAVILAATSLFLPWLTVNGSAMAVWQSLPLAILAVTATVIPLAAIFMFHNPGRQQTAVGVAAFISVAALGYVVALTFLGPDSNVKVTLAAPCCMALSGAMDTMARAAIRRDIRRLRDSNRLR